MKWLALLIREADRLNPAAADVLLKVLEEPPADSVLLLLSARPDEIPETVLSRCHVVSFLPLAEPFVAKTLEEEGAAADVALLCARLAGGTGLVRRGVGPPSGKDGLSFRDAAREALDLTAMGPPGALAAAEAVMAASSAFRKSLREELPDELAPFLDERGRPEEAFRGVVKRIEERHHRRERRAERDYVDWVLLSVSSLLRDRVAVGNGARPGLRINLDLEPGEGSPAGAARAMGAIEEARAALADETNLNVRLVLEDAFLKVSALAA